MQTVLRTVCFALGCDKGRSARIVPHGTTRSIYIVPFPREGAADIYKPVFRKGRKSRGLALIRLSRGMQPVPEPTGTGSSNGGALTYKPS